MKQNVKKGFLIALGVVMIAVGIHFFLLPANLSLGGATGMALILKNFLPLDTGILLIIVNVVLFVLGFLMIGNAFGTLTVISSIALSGLVWLFEKIFPLQGPLLENTFLSLVVAVILYGTGVGIVLNQSASTGGSDIIAKIINKFTGMNLGRACLVTDFVITCVVGVTYGLEIALYCLVGVILNGLIIDYTIDGMNSGRLCMIHSKHPREIADFLIGCGRSATLYEAIGAYSKEKKTVVETVVTTRNFIQLKKHLKEIDPDVFMVVTTANNIFGFNWNRLED